MDLRNSDNGKPIPFSRIVDGFPRITEPPFKQRIASLVVLILVLVLAIVCVTGAIWSLTAEPKPEVLKMLISAQPDNPQPGMESQSPTDAYLKLKHANTEEALDILKTVASILAPLITLFAGYLFGRKQIDG